MEWDFSRIVAIFDEYSEKLELDPCFVTLQSLKSILNKILNKMMQPTVTIKSGATTVAIRLQTVYRLPLFLTH